jgi:hypothetical protein
MTTTQRHILFGWATALVVVLLLSRVRIVTGDVLDDAVHGVMRDIFTCGEEIAIPSYNLTQMSMYF